MGFLSKLLGNKDRAEPQEHSQPVKQVAVVELRSPWLLAFDLPSEGARYEVPDFVPGLYEIPLNAIEKADSSKQQENGVIEVDTGVIYFIDADHADSFRAFEAKLFEETGDSYVMVESPVDYAGEVGIRFDCLVSPGYDAGSDFVGDGTYVLNASLIKKA